MSVISITLIRRLGMRLLRSFVEKLREVVFPRAQEEARELFRAGQKQGVLSRQSGESMQSYVSRRRRWWKLLRSLDDSIELSEPMRVELLLELSRLTRQEVLVVRACARDLKSFDSIATVLVALALNSIEELNDTAEAGHAVHLQLATYAAFGKAKGKGKRPKGKGKGKGKGKVVRSRLTLKPSKRRASAFAVVV